MLLLEKVTSPRGFEWLSQMRFYFDPKKPDVLQQLSIHMANAQFNYGFEYLGVQDKLVQTPLTDRLYLTMTQALEERLGGSPFGQCIAVLLLFIFGCVQMLKRMKGTEVPNPRRSSACDCTCVLTRLSRDSLMLAMHIVLFLPMQSSLTSF